MKNNSKNKKKAEKMLATVVMGMNLVNAAAPVATLAAAEQVPAIQQPQIRNEQHQTYNYEVLPQLAGYVDEFVCPRAEAAPVTVGSGVSSSFASNVGGIIVENGGTAQITNNNAGSLVVKGGNVSVASNNNHVSVYDGYTKIDLNSDKVEVSGGICEIGKNALYQEVYGGTGIIGEMVVVGSNGLVYQNITGGVGSIGVMDGGGGYQNIGSGTEGYISVMNAGSQAISVNGIGKIENMKDGEQYFFIVNNGIATATIGTMSGGTQRGKSGCTVSIDVMSGGKQWVDGGQGSIDKMIGGSQRVGWGTNDSATNGTVKVMEGGTQVVYSRAVGVIELMSGAGARQTIGASSGTAADASGSISRMEAGRQSVICGSGSIDQMISGIQYVGWGLKTPTSTAHGTIKVMESGAQLIYSNTTGTVQEMNGGQQEANLGGTAVVGHMKGSGAFQMIGVTGIASGSIDCMDAGMQVIGYDGRGSGSGTIAIMNGGTQMIRSQSIGTVSTMNGGTQIVSSGGTANGTVAKEGAVQYIFAGAVISGTVLDEGTLRLAQTDSTYTLTNKLTVNNGKIDMTDGAGLVSKSRSNPTYQTMTVNGLQGTGGSIYLDTDLVGNQGDKLIIDSNSTGTGTFGIYIKDLNSINDTQLKGNLLLVTDESKKLNFSGVVANNGGLWDVTPILLQQNDRDWYLTNIIKTVNNDTGVLLAAVDNSYALWRNTNDSLRSRLGSLASGREQADGIWARTQAGRFSGDGYEGRYNLYQLGFDQQFTDGSIYGGAIDYGDGSGSYEPGSGKDKLRSFSLYGVWRGDSGTYTNVTARVGNFSTDLESYGDYPDKADYKQHAYSISVEYGKRFDLERGLFIEPQAQFTLGRLGSVNYTTDRGTNGYIEGMNSAIGRIGLVMGQKINNGSDIYLKADLLHEFAGERDLQLTSDAGGSNDILTKHNDYGDTWFELGIGGNVKISKTGNFYGDLTRGFGGDIDKKWQFNAGLRFEF